MSHIHTELCYASLSCETEAYAKLQSENAALREYLQHKPHCEIHLPGGTEYSAFLDQDVLVRSQCSCGLAKLLEGE